MQALSCLAYAGAMYRGPAVSIRKHVLGSVNKHEARGSAASLTYLSAGFDPPKYAGSSALLFAAASSRCYIEVLKFGSPSGHLSGNLSSP
ncbi:hypothetical protein KL933_002849 [Ogataea haglerorum]|uniref:Uncharacterized protein n=1 Tax=Ogataea haglerorum TaxID=1937702 RepID=A0AAN6D6S4_9ASCO|nr:hypothetical protein KL933_002849 [Ogataea haglerorum]KAG7741938.1 hypothetical protein KL923_001193 [Ogataea haglerorum]KAG7760900.1 hypothetical protein KL947_000871 [Ogataea haglerorum]